MSAAAVYSTLFGRAMVLGQTGINAPEDIGLLWLASGDQPATAFPTEGAAESAIADTIASAAAESSWADRSSYLIAEPGVRIVRHRAKRGTA